MPYTMDNMPESMKGSPKQAMEIFIAAFNTAFEKNHVEGAAMAIAMAAVHKAGYKKDEQGHWMRSSPLSPSKGGEVSPAGGGLPSKVVIGGAGGGNHSELVPAPDSGNRGDQGWIPIFKTGAHTDSAGNEKTWTEADLDTIVQKYKPQEHEAPAVIGHPEHNSPAWGWVEGLKRDGIFLFARFKGLVPEFVEMMRKGLFKKRSISLFPDMTLRHVGFLGAMPPAVKGLPDVAFADKEGQIIEFNFDCKQCNRCTNTFFGREAKRMKWFEWLKSKATAEGVAIEDAPQSFADGTKSEIPNPKLIETLVDAEVAKVVTAKNAEFAEARRTLDAEKARLKAEGERLKKLEGERMKDEIASFCEGLCKDGKLTPAMTKYGMGMTNFLEAISGIETQYDFCEPTPNPSQEGKKLTPAEHMKGFLSCFKKQIEFGEFANTGNDIPKGDGKRDAAIRDYQEKNTKDGVEITYKDAVLAVSKEQPELFKR